ncbi:16S rRNA (guanine(527)-N(7))-methyltransferase RsmG [Rhodoferax sp. 4810]|uniref:Ribosomal RNA small subunit methyltransferase G n=1 Tax=Thiospirillum jenense TaxID=1653858 RepID=A0A839HG09_9GAMM|nr:16S rRNA (guanine(527)-N(7))-methyltransferase RsmG [Thiospirillum jenense]MBB1076332.1 16S rRNA (guanine(527)-N(7))-methyltransferase RsmG [Rhodoferax jenense]MBB1126256.1 16S rRNA (guanine(527)-N(7))-methyltransferase RsmG [Thiospirillum jenense]
MMSPLQIAQRTRLEQGLIQLNIVFTGEQITALLHYLDVLAQWNHHYNLTAIRDPLDMVARHLLDSLAVLPYLHAGCALDLGSGAGLPGIPLAIAQPTLQWVLLDSAGKKTRFLRHVISELNLRNVAVVQTRIEHYQPSQRFNTITARALADLMTLWQWTHAFCTTDAHLLALKGRCPDVELTALNTAGAHYQVHRLMVPDLNSERHLIDITCQGSNLT